MTSSLCPLLSFTDCDVASINTGIAIVRILLTRCTYLRCELGYDKMFSYIIHSAKYNIIGSIRWQYVMPSLQLLDFAHRDQH